VVRARAGGLTVALEPVTGDAAAAAVRRLAAEDLPARLSSGDATLWGPEAREEAAIRLGWLDLPDSSRSLLPGLSGFAAELRSAGLDRVVLAGMGGSSLAPEVITAEHGRELIVLDGTDPGQVRRALHRDLERTVVVVSSKSGTTVETDSHRRATDRHDLCLCPNSKALNPRLSA
jgi:glucose-6-phosphate isomerase